MRRSRWTLAPPELNDVSMGRLVLALVLIAGVARAGTELEGVEIVRKPGLAVRLRLSAPATATVRTLPAEGDRPARVYLDFPGKLAASAPAVVGGAAPLVRVRTGQFDQSTVRVVLDLVNPVDFELREQPRAITIALGSGPPRAAHATDTVPATEDTVLVPNLPETPPAPRVTETSPAPVAKAAPPTEAAPAPPAKTPPPSAPPPAASSVPSAPLVKQPAPVVVVKEAPPAPLAKATPPATSVPTPAPSATPPEQSAMTPTPPAEPPLVRERASAPLAKATPPPPSEVPPAQSAMTPAPAPPAPPPAAVKPPVALQPSPVAIQPPPTATPSDVARTERAVPPPVELPRPDLLLPPETGKRGRPAARENRRPVLVVLDAGHGGHDPGATGLSGVYEKTITLDIARRVAERLAAEMPVEVALTRTDDTFVPIEYRVARAAEASLFVSLHANAGTPTLSGVEVFYGGGGSRAADAGPGSPVRLGLDVVDALERALGGVRTTVRRGDFYVLTRNTVPSVLVEIGYLTNPADAARIADDAYLTRVAQAIADGAAAFLRDPTALAAR